jgi:A/G-specific adenine glycosylase
MPWRDDPEPYRVFLSEIMLQQTQVATVIPYFERFTARFPDWSALAEAEEEEVLALWSGLGYYRRARNLQAAAQIVVEEQGGELPADLAFLGALPGVGPYTAGAVASIAFQVEAPALDGNGIRLLTRLEALPGDPARQPLKALLWRRLGELVRGPRPGDLNQAVMELAARICRPRNPDCENCPLAPDCRALAAGESERFPELNRPAAPLSLVLEVGIFRDSRGLLLARGSDRPFLAGLWNLPYRVLDGAGRFPDESWRELGLEPGDARIVGSGDHGITRYRIEQRVLAGETVSLIAEAPLEYRWVKEEELSKLGLPAFSTKLLKRFTR